MTQAAVRGRRDLSEKLFEGGTAGIEVPEKYLTGLTRVLYGEVPEAVIQKINWHSA